MGFLVVCCSIGFLLSNIFISFIPLKARSGFNEAVGKVHYLIRLKLMSPEGASNPLNLSAI